MVDKVLKELARVRQDVFPSGPSVDSAGAVAARSVAADAVLGAQRAAAGGGDRLQHIVSLVRGAELGRCGGGCHGVFQEPRPFARGKWPRSFCRWWWSK